MLRKNHLPSGTFDTSPSSLRAKGGALSRCVELWLADGQASGWSLRTVSARRDMMEKFSWWLHQEEVPSRLEEITPEAVRFFLAYLRADAKDGRWEDPRPNTSRAARPSTVDTYFWCFRAFFNFIVREGLLAESPMKKVTPPRIPKDQIQPFTPEQAQALIDAAKGGDQPLRDTALLLILLDTGLRVSELCSLTITAVDPETKDLSVVGKGGKRRTVYLSPPVRRCLWKYIEHERRMAADDEPLFIATRGRRAEGGLTPSGICQLFHRLGVAAGIRGVRCSPHTARHYYAITMLRNGANLFELQQLMGHEDLTMLRRYVMLAQADLALVHRKAPPAARLKV
jgi:site-specific recombinase XerD